MAPSVILPATTFRVFKTTVGLIKKHKRKLIPYRGIDREPNDPMLIHVASRQQTTLFREKMAQLFAILAKNSMQVGLKPQLDKDTSSASVVVKRAMRTNSSVCESCGILLTEYEKKHSMTLNFITNIGFGFLDHHCCVV